MDTVLLVSGSQPESETLSSLLAPALFADVFPVVSAAKARRLITEREFGLILVNTPLSDETGNTFAEDIAETSGLDVILLTDTDSLAKEFGGWPQGVIVLEKPADHYLLEKAIEIIQFSKSKINELLRENKKLIAKLEETRLVGQAKCILIERKKMTENEAHRHIEKLAMNNRTPKKEIAKDILRSYSV